MGAHQRGVHDLICSVSGKHQGPGLLSGLGFCSFSVIFVRQFLPCRVTEKICHPLLVATSLTLAGHHTFTLSS